MSVDLDMVAEMKSINENLLKLIELQEVANKIVKQWNLDGLPEKKSD